MQLADVRHRLWFCAALANALSPQLIGAATISTPYGGSQAAQTVGLMLPFNRVLQDIRPGSPPIEEANWLPILHPWTNIVTTKGQSSLMLSVNDGIVTQRLMRRRGDIRLAEVDSNHFDVLLNPETLRLIEEAIQEVRAETSNEWRLSGRENHLAGLHVVLQYFRTDVDFAQCMLDDVHGFIPAEAGQSVRPDHRRCSALMHPP